MPGSTIYMSSERWRLGVRMVAPSCWMFDINCILHCSKIHDFFKRVEDVGFEFETKCFYF